MRKSQSLFIGLVCMLTSALTFGAGAQANSFTEYDAQIIKDYTSVGYFISNGIEDRIDGGVEGLEGPIFPGTNPDEEGAAHNYQYFMQLNRALDRLPVYGTPGTTVVYRGIYSTDQEQTPEQRFFKGRVWLERRFSSSTTSLEVATKFAMGAYKNEGCGGCSANVKKPNPKNAIILHIVHRTGREITQWAADKSEKEVLFKSGTLFKVVDAKRDTRKRYIVHIVELDPTNLADTDRSALIGAEGRRLETIIKTNFSPAGKLADEIKKWNEAHRRWKSEGLLDKIIDFEYWNQGGG